MRVLITGASGLVGTALTKKLIAQGHEVSVLSRSSKDFLGCKVYVWDYKKKSIDVASVKNTDAIIHLAGATVSEKWTDSYKKEILDSRIKTADLLYETCNSLGEFPKVFITASGSAYYGQLTQAKPFKENDPSGDDFLAHVTVKWEAAADKFKDKSRIVKIRTSVVLSKNGGALAKMLPAAKFSVLSPIGNGNQFFPWIHLDDLVEIYCKALTNEKIEGAYNAAAPESTTNTDFTHALMKVLGQNVWFPKVPAFMIKLILGEMSAILLEGSPLDISKTQRELHDFEYKTIENALKEILK